MNAKERQHPLITLYSWMVVAICFVAYITLMAGHPGLDTIGILQETKDFVHGQELYEDIAQPNLPWVHFLYVPVILASDLLGVETEYVYYAYINCFIGISFYLAWRLLSMLQLSATTVRLCLSVMALLIFVLQVRMVLLGDRMHLFFICTLPYFLMNSPAFHSLDISRRMRALTGGFAAIGFFFKPYNILFWLGIQLYLVCMRKRVLAVIFSAENITIYVLFVFYALAMVTLTPAYFSTMMPLNLETYSMYYRPLSEKMPGIFDLSWKFLLVVGISSYGLKFSGLSKLDKANLAYLFLLAGISIAYIFSASGWHYDYFPLSAVLMIVAILLFAMLIKQHNHTQYENEKKRNDGRLFNALVAISIIMIFFADKFDALATRIQFYYERNGASYDSYHLNTEVNRFFEAELKDSRTFVFLSGVVMGAQMNKDYGGENVTSLNPFWPYVGYVKRMNLATDEKEKASLGWVQDYITRKVTEDIEKKTPDTVIIDTSTKLYPQFPDGNDILGFLQQDESFKRAWKHYNYSAEINVCNEERVVACGFISFKRR